MENTNKYDQIVEAIYKDPIGYIATLHNVIEDSNNRVEEHLKEMDKKRSELDELLSVMNKITTDNK